VYSNLYTIRCSDLLDSAPSFGELTLAIGPAHDFGVPGDYALTGSSLRFLDYNESGRTGLFGMLDADVPEPITATMVFLGVLGLFGANRFRKPGQTKPAPPQSH